MDAKLHDTSNFGGKKFFRPTFEVFLYQKKTFEVFG
jgi:hypothetical protein